MFDWLTAPIATAAAGLLGFKGQTDTNAANIALGQKQMDFQERLSNTAYQRQVADMQSAGLNPMLAYVKGGGASSPAGSMPQVQNPFSAGISSAESAARTSLTQKQVPKTEAETVNIGADTILRRANTLLANANQALSYASADERRAHISLMEHQSKKISEEVKNIPLEGARLTYVVRELALSFELISKQVKTEEQRILQMTALALKTLKESDLLQFDLDAIKKSGNLGKEFGQYKNVIDTLTSIFHMLRR